MIPFTSNVNGASPVLWAGLAIVSLLGLTGCYSYQPVIRDDLSPGDPVRLRLSAAAAEELSDRVGLPVRSLEGPLLRMTPDSLRVETGWGAYLAGTVFEARRDTLQFHRNQVLEVDRRDFSRVRTGILIAALAAVGVAIIQSIGGGGDPDQDPGPSDPTFIRIPVP